MKRQTWTFPPNCKRGHPYGPNPPRDERGSRMCMQCRTGARLCAQCRLRPVTRKRAVYCSKACSNAARGRPLADRFLDFFVPGNADSCWPWTGSRDANGYGVITDDHGRQLRAHRVAYERTNGPVQSGKYVCHTCDNPPCCNPAHLWLGTVIENNADKRNKLRHPHEDTHPKAKLTSATVRAIRTQYAASKGAADLADTYGVSRATIYDVVYRRRWQRVN